MRTEVSLISPAPIIRKENKIKPITNTNNAGIILISPCFNQANGNTTINKMNTILLLIILERISVHERMINNKITIDCSPIIHPFIRSTKLPSYLVNTAVTILEVSNSNLL